jgi:hypothetical protein
VRRLGSRFDGQQTSFAVLAPARASRERSRQSLNAGFGFVNAGMLDVKGVADLLNVGASFVYEHADEPGARRLGTGPKPRLRFDPADVQKWLDSCSEGRRSEQAAEAVVTPIRRRRTKASLAQMLFCCPFEASQRPREKSGGAPPLRFDPRPGQAGARASFEGCRGPRIEEWSKGCRK